MKNFEKVSVLEWLMKYCSYWVEKLKHTEYNIECTEKAWIAEIVDSTENCRKWDENWKCIKHNKIPKPDP